MAKKNKKATEKDSFKTVESALSRAEKFIETNQKAFLYGLGGVLVVVLGIIGYFKLIREPHIKEAWAVSFMAEQYFVKDSFNLALNGDGDNPGFIDIVDEYNKTPMGNAAKYYAGVCFMRLNDFESAIEYLESFKSKDPMVGAIAKSLIGDANIELGNIDEAINYYLKAVEQADNELLSPVFLMKVGKAYELKKDYKSALEAYRKIETDFYGTKEQINIEKYITRCELYL
ncbi:MAG: tetratricopeptide repeat protein [Bacteroidales bacterium]|jgi:tetratricopeptide (TPR) repeat protein|nr:tetratricopeptide repeat protein [Bacteroidales bacterium]MCK9498391.1 tetratricopeptide repeat protein [Bacteroidales bacterium]MDY0314191.1 tetratricopeptide repeat protein [Bacteroidales bacterium]NLB86361.1 tetratricopeptide repeat protein [Bacteroidales bacterium]